MEINWYVAVIVLGAIAILAFERLVREIAHLNLQIDGPKVFDPWYSKFEPLTDEDFVARCHPGVKAETALKVRAIIADQLAIPPERIHPEHRLVEDLLAD